MSKLVLAMKTSKLTSSGPRSWSDLVPLQVLVPILSTVVALGIGLLIIAATGGSVTEAIEAFWD